MKPKLTIAIPTYNRAAELKKCLTRVMEYSEGKNIEILVSDNASQDETEEVVREAKTNYPGIRYYRNSDNLGFDGNFLNCFEKSTGEYVWLMSDDDIMLPGAIDSVLEACQRMPVCIHLNSAGIVSETPLQMGRARFEWNGLLEFRNRNDFIEKIGMYCTFVSSLVYRRNLIERLENKEKYFGTNILQSHILFEVMRTDGVYIIDTFTCLAAKGNKSVKYDVLETWVKNYSELLLTTAPRCGFDKNLMNKMLREELGTGIFELVISFRQTCENESKWNRECIWKYIERYPELIRKYKKAVNCPLIELRAIQFNYKIGRHLRGLWRKVR